MSVCISHKHMHSFSGAIKLMHLLMSSTGTMVIRLVLDAELLTTIISSAVWCGGCVNQKTFFHHQQRNCDLASAAQCWWPPFSDYLLFLDPKSVGSSNYLCLALYFFFKEKGRKALESFTLNLEEALSSNNFLLRNIFSKLFRAVL